MTQNEPTVFVVDDDESLRKMVCRLLKSLGVRVEDYGTAEEFLAASDPDRPGCLLLDIRMPGMSGLELQDKLTACKIRLPIIFVTGHGDVPMAVHCIQTGAVDFIEKPFREQVLLDRINRALVQDSNQRAQEAERQAMEARLSLLTAREQQIMDLLVAGHSTKMVAARLQVSPKTVDVHRARILQKVGADSLAELVHKVLTIQR